MTPPWVNGLLFCLGPTTIVGLCWLCLQKFEFYITKLAKTCFV